MLKQLIFLAASAALFSSCTKDPGVGGKATITGTVMEEDWNINTGTLIDSYPALDQRVYIDYGADGFLDDDVRTNYEGVYEFRWLRKGSYEIVVYSECPTCESGQEVVRVPVTISDNKEVLEAPIITRENW